MSTAKSSQPRLGLRDLRKVREDMEHERYMTLRREQHRLGLWAPESKLREEARKYANESCRLLLARHNEAIEA